MINLLSSPPQSILFPRFTYATSRNASSDRYLLPRDTFLSRSISSNIPSVVVMASSLPYNATEVKLTNESMEMGSDSLSSKLIIFTTPLLLAMTRRSSCVWYTTWEFPSGKCDRFLYDMDQRQSNIREGKEVMG